MGKPDSLAEAQTLGKPAGSKLQKNWQRHGSLTIWLRRERLSIPLQRGSQMSRWRRCSLPSRLGVKT
jgi:hypothetical protein